MFVKDFILLPAISWCVLQGCFSQECEDYYESNIRKHSDCPRLTIEKGSYCYTEIDEAHWQAKISCFRGYHLVGLSIRHCTDDGYVFSNWSWDNGYTSCVPDDTTTAITTTTSTTTTSVTSSSTLTTTATTESSTATTSSLPVVSSEETNANYSSSESDKDTKSRLIVYVCVSIATMVSIVIGLVIIIHIYRRQKRMTTKVANSQDANTSIGINNAYDDADVVVGNLESEYVAVPDTDDQLSGDDEYNTIHSRERMNNNSNYNHIQIHIQSDTYDSTRHYPDNIPNEEDRYSHLNATDHTKYNSGLNNDDGNVYNTLKVGGNFVAMNEQHSNGAESHYDHTNEKNEKSSRIELSTYDHVVYNSMYANEGIQR